MPIDFFPILFSFIVFCLFMDLLDLLMYARYEPLYVLQMMVSIDEQKFLNNNPGSQNQSLFL